MPSHTPPDRRAPHTPPSLDQVVATAPQLPEDQRPGGAPSVRTGWGSLPNPSFHKPPTKGRDETRIEPPVDVEFEDGKGYTVLRVREEKAKSFSARTFRASLGTAYLVAGQDDLRSRLVVTAVDQDLVIGTLSDVTAGMGFTIPAHGAFEIHLTDAFYVTPASVSGSVGVWVERDE